MIRISAWRLGQVSAHWLLSTAVLRQLPATAHRSIFWVSRPRLRATDEAGNRATVIHGAP